MEAEKVEKKIDREKAKQRSLWLSALKLSTKEERLFELEVLLKGLDRFFNLENLPLNSEESPIRLNFVEELTIAGNGYARITELSRRFLEASERSFYQFRYYVETELLGDLARSRVIEQSLAQRNPEESLMLLYSYFLSLKNLCRELVKTKEVRYPLFFHLGCLTSRAIAQNRFFNPTRELEFLPEYDRVANRIVKNAVREVKDSDLKNMISVLILSFYRLLHYLSFVDEQSEDIEKLKQSLIIFALINSEARHLIRFLEFELKPKAEKKKDPLAERFTNLADGLGFQLSMELRKINHTELLSVAKQTELDLLRASVENSKGVLINFLEQSIVQMAQELTPEIKGEEIFPNFISRKQISLKLREDLAIFRALMDKFEEITETSISGASLNSYLSYLKLQKSYIQYLERFTAPFIRYSDLIEFRRYFGKIKALSVEDLHRMDKLEGFKMESKFFKIFLETTLSHINQRADLRDEPGIDEKQIREKLKIFVNRELERMKGAK